jgi:hypothetical protein
MYRSDVPRVRAVMRFPSCRRMLETFKLTRMHRRISEPVWYALSNIEKQLFMIRSSELNRH